jgi:hypothetical protein
MQTTGCQLLSCAPSNFRAIVLESEAGAAIGYGRFGIIIGVSDARANFGVRAFFVEGE